MEFLNPNFLIIIPLFMVLVIVKIFFYKKTSSVQVSSFNSLKNFFGNQGKIKVFFINALFIVALLLIIVGFVGTVYLLSCYLFGLLKIKNYKTN